MLNINKLKRYVRIKLSLGIKGKELNNEYQDLVYDLGVDKALETLADKIVDSCKHLDEIYSSLYVSNVNKLEKSRNVINYNTLDDEIHQTIAKLIADFNEKQVQFIVSPDKPINILCGSVRSGKTWVACFKFGIKVLSSDEDAKFMMVGSTLKSLESNCFKYFKKLFGSYFDYTLSNKTAVLFGHEIRLEGAPNERAVDKITGDTLAGAFVDEIQTIPENFIMQLYSRCSDGDGFIYGTCNPRHPKHWLYTKWIKGKDMKDVVAYWNFVVSDNKFLPKKYVDSLPKLFSGVFYDRNVLGKWVAAEGVVFSRFANNHSDYIIDKIDRNKVGYAIAGIDFGGNKSGSTIVITGFCKQLSDGLIVLHSAKLKDEKGEIDPVRLNKWIIDNIKEFKLKFNIPLIEINCDSAEQYLEAGIRNEVRRSGLGIPTVDALKIEIMDRVKFVQRAFALGILKIYKDCDTLIDCLDELVYDDKKIEDKLLDDGSTDNDTWDAFSYSFEKYKDRYNYIAA